MQNFEHLINFYKHKWAYKSDRDLKTTVTLDSWIDMQESTVYSNLIFRQAAITERRVLILNLVSFSYTYAMKNSWHNKVYRTFY